MMTDKPKRKNDQPIPRRYWWIFGTLAILLLINLRFPVKIIVSNHLNTLPYLIVMLVCIVVLIDFIRRFHWKQAVTIVIALCILLGGFNIFFGFQPMSDTCTTQHSRILTTYTCLTLTWYMAWIDADYVGLRGIPIVVMVAKR
jgi:hypothetical protein